MKSPVGELREADIEHRKEYQKFVINDGDPVVSKLIDIWNGWNIDLFNNCFTICPMILLAEPSTPSRYGDYAVIGGYGNRSQIRIHPSLLDGTHPHTLPGPRYQEGRFLLVADVLLHETVHLWQAEVIGDLEESFHGHGPRFRDKCNDVGAKLGLPPVRACQKRGRDKGLPSCSQFPFNIRPQDYYKGAYVPKKSKPTSLRRRLEALLKEFRIEQIYTELETLQYFL